VSPSSKKSYRIKAWPAIWEVDHREKDEFLHHTGTGALQKKARRKEAVEKRKDEHAAIRSGE